MLRADGAFGIYPEGTRSRTAGSTAAVPGWPGSRSTSGAPVVPVALAGTQDIQPAGAKRPRIRPVTLRFGRPMVFVEQPGVPPGRLRREVTDQIMDAIHAMSGEELAGVYNNELPADD